MIEKSLSDLRVGVSISESPDLERLGFLPRELDRVLGDVLSSLIYRGATILYGGDFRDDGYTVRIAKEAAGAWRTHEGETDLVFAHYAAAPVWRNFTPNKVWRYLDSLCDFGRLKVYGPAGLLVEFTPSHRASPNSNEQSMVVVAERAAATRSKSPDIMHMQSENEFSNYWIGLTRSQVEVSQSASYTTMRRGMAEEEDARIVLAGWVNDHDGQGSGIAEEVILGLEGDKLLVPFPVYGGCAHDAAVALGLTLRTL